MQKKELAVWWTLFYTIMILEQLIQSNQIA